MLTEMIYHTDCNEYKIVEHFMSTYFDEVHGFLIKNECLERYNFYMIDYSFVVYPFDPKYIVENFKLIPLNVAQAVFPQYNLDESNYGF